MLTVEVIFDPAAAQAVCGQAHHDLRQPDQVLAAVNEAYQGAEHVVPNYNVMGPVKAALEASARYLAYELGPQRIRVHAISPGPLKTRAASGLKAMRSPYRSNRLA